MHKPSAWAARPAINLFEQSAEPINVTQQRYEYRIVPDVARPLSTEVYSVDAVTSIDPVSVEVTEYQPFYSFRHGVPGSRSKPSGMRRGGPRPAIKPPMFI